MAFPHKAYSLMCKNLGFIFASTLLLNRLYHVAEGENFHKFQTSLVICENFIINILLKHLSL